MPTDPVEQSRFLADENLYPAAYPETSAAPGGGRGGSQPGGGESQTRPSVDANGNSGMVTTTIFIHNRSSR